MSDHQMHKLDNGTPTAQWAAGRIRELETALRELTEWARDIAGDHSDQEQRDKEDEMMERMDSILAKHRHSSVTEFEEALASDICRYIQSVRT